MRSASTVAPLVILATCMLAAGGCAHPGSVEPMTITSSPDFQREVLESRQPVVVVEFYKTFCPACEVLAPKIAELAGEYQGKAKFVRVDNHKEDLLAQYKIMYFPTVLLIVNSREQRRWINEQDKAVYQRAIDEALRENPSVP